MFHVPKTSTRVGCGKIEEAAEYSNVLIQQIYGISVELAIPLSVEWKSGENKLRTYNKNIPSLRFTEVRHDGVVDLSSHRGKDGVPQGNVQDG